MYLLGCAQGAREGVDLNLLSRKPLEDFLHRKGSRHHVKEGRWKPFKEKGKKLINKIKAEAEELYTRERGGWHHDLAYQLHKNPAYREIPLKSIRKAIAPIADKFGKKFGVKKKQ